MRAGSSRVVIVGAGAWVFPLELSRDVLSFPALSGPTSCSTTSTWRRPSAPGTSVEALIGIGGLGARVRVATELGEALRGPLTSAVLTLPQIHEMTDRMLEAEAPWLPQFATGPA